MADAPNWSHDDTEQEERDELGKAEREADEQAQRPAKLRSAKGSTQTPSPTTVSR